MYRALRLTLLLVCSCVLTACGGGGGGGRGNGDNSTPAPSTPPSGGTAPTPPPADLTRAELETASRLLARTTFGATWEEINDAAALGAEDWIDRQFASPMTNQTQKVIEIYQDYSASDDPDRFWRYAWWSSVLPAEDQLRQRVAYALSQIMVVSATVEELPLVVVALPAYWDLLARNAFGNFRTLLRDVALSPAMGLYLSHLNNAKANPAANTFPDENFAREVMQLFSIGLFELNADGSRRLDADGNPIPSYDNGDIREYARVFTGLSFGGDNTEFGRRQDGNWAVPMAMFESAHDAASKTLIDGTRTAAGQSGLEDIEQAIDSLFNHPNVGPFIGRQLIQRLVTSNPSPAYVERVAAAFAAPPRGDMKRVLRAILLDPEALTPPDPDSDFGKLREPFLRYTALLRQLHAAPTSGDLYATVGGILRITTDQHVLESPSVFNFFAPDYVPGPEFGAAGLVGPEFQITTASRIIGVSNLMANGVLNEPMDIADGYPPVRTNRAEFVALAEDLDALLDRLDIQFTYGTLRPSARQTIADSAAITPDPQLRTDLALYLLLLSPDYAVQL